MKIDGQKVVGCHFAYEGCHKIYICENKEDEKQMREWGYDIFPISAIKDAWDSSCSLRFISNANLDKAYVNQFKDAVFEETDRLSTVCDLENLYNALERKGRTTLLNSCEVIKTEEDGLCWYDIVRLDSKTPIICDGEYHTFINNGNGTWSNVPTEDSGSHEVLLTQEEFEFISSYRD